MTQPVQSVSPVSPSYPTSAPNPTPPVGQGGQAAVQAPTTIEVSRAASAPIYVYRVTDTATGRTLVEIPQQPATPPGDTPGGRVDAKV